MEKLLVTGCCGFIGSNFIRGFLKKNKGTKIVNLDKLTYAGRLESLADLQGNSNYEFVQGDICDPAIVEKAMNGCQAIVNFAAESHVDRSIHDPAPFIMTNVAGTQTLLDAALKNNVKRFHHISTDEVFGSLELNDTNKFNERTNYDPRSPYAASKAGSDHLVRAYYHTYGLPITITNCSNNFGPYQFPEKIIPLAITNLLEGKKVPIYGDGLYVRDWLYVDDHCRAIDLILQKGEVGKTYLIGGLTEDISNIKIIKKILRIMGKDDNQIEYVKDRPGHDRRYAIDWSTIHKELGWSPNYNFDQALEETIDWYKHNSIWLKRIKSGTYTEYYQTQYGK